MGCCNYNLSLFPMQRDQDPNAKGNRPNLNGSIASISYLAYVMCFLMADRDDHDDDVHVTVEGHSFRQIFRPSLKSTVVAMWVTLSELLSYRLVDARQITVYVGSKRDILNSMDVNQLDSNKKKRKIIRMDHDNGQKMWWHFSSWQFDREKM